MGFDVLFDKENTRRRTTGRSGQETAAGGQDSVRSPYRAIPGKATQCFLGHGTCHRLRRGNRHCDRLLARRITSACT